MKTRPPLVNLLKSTRIERALIPISFIILTASFANQITSQVITLIICSTLLYISGGILNAKIDNDYPLPKSTSTIITILILITITLSLQNKIILTSVLTWTALNIIYNKYSRRILFGDSLILSLTHTGIPVIATALLLNIPAILTIKITTFSIIFAILLIPMKNLKGLQDDKKRNYKTLLTKYQNGKLLTAIFLNCSFILLALAPIIFNLSPKYFALALIPIIIYITTNYLILKNKKTEAYFLSRLIPLTATLIFTITLNTKPTITLASTATIILYLTYLKWNTTT